MLDISLDHNIDRYARYLTRTACDVMMVERQALPRILRQPTSWISQGIRFTPATKAELISSVYVLPGQRQYLSPSGYDLRRPGTVGGWRGRSTSGSTAMAT